MIITAHDRKVPLSLSESEHDEQRPKRKYGSGKLGKAYSEIAKYPGRVVSTETAYGRMRRHPEMSLHDACTTPKLHRRSGEIKQVYSRRKVADQVPAEYLAALKSKRSSNSIARAWTLDPCSVRRHRQLLREESQP